MWTRRFWKAATERAAKSAAQGVLLLAGADQLNAFHFDWQTAGGVALGAALLSYLTSVGTGLVTDGGPSLTNDEILAQPVA